MTLASLLTGMVMAGLTREAATYHRAGATVLFIDNVVGPYLQTAAEGRLDPDRSAELDRILSRPGLDSRVPYLEVWMPDGTVVYSKSGELTGKKFELPDAAARAFRGEVHVSIADLYAAEHASRGISTPYFEIYSPLRRAETGEIIAVIEVHELQEPILETVNGAIAQTWSAVALSFLTLFASLFFVVRGAGRTIITQKQDLARQLQETRQLAAHNDTLRHAAVEASILNTELHEGLLNSIGSDLHDGPAQLLAYAGLKIESIKRAATPEARLEYLHDLETQLQQATDDIRDIATGLVLPDIETLDLATVISEVIASYEHRTSTQVELELQHLPRDSSVPFKICVYRFLQEGLNNVWHYGTPDSARISAGLKGQVFHLTVSNRINERHETSRRRHGLGLRALNVRVETIGGKVELICADGIAQLELRLPSDEGQDQ